jgi:hypothetical protein
VPIPSGLRQYWKGHLVGKLDETLADGLIAAAADANESSFRLGELIHGVAHRVPEARAAFGGRAPLPTRRRSLSGSSRRPTSGRSPGRAAWPTQWRLSRFEAVVTSIIPSLIRRLHG